MESHIIALTVITNSKQRKTFRIISLDSCPISLIDAHSARNDTSVLMSDETIFINFTRRRMSPNRRNWIIRKLKIQLFLIKIYKTLVLINKFLKILINFNILSLFNNTIARVMIYILIMDMKLKEWGSKSPPLYAFSSH